MNNLYSMSELKTNKKIDLKQKKNNVFNSLFEVEQLLKNFDKLFKCGKLYKILK